MGDACDPSKAGRDDSVGSGHDAGDRARRLSTVVAEVRTTLGRGLVSRLVRAGLAVLILAALVVAYESVNFFFYFTVLSNLLLIAVLAGEAINPGWMDTNGVLRGASTLYMAVTGLVYAVLLRPIEADVGLTAAWINYVLHSLAPAAAMIDWLLFSPGRRLERKVLWLWLVFPAVFLGATLIRGPLVDWYPYPFLDPDETAGYVGVVAYSVLILAIFLVLGVFIRWWSNARSAPTTRA